MESSRERQAPKRAEEAEITHGVRYDFAGKLLKSIIKKLDKDSKIGDIPCGGGYGPERLDLDEAHIYGMDISEEAIEHAIKYFSKENIHFISGDVTKMTRIYKNKFDAIVSFEGIEHFKKPENFLKQVHSILKEDGSFIISTPRKPHGSPFHIKELNLDEFQTMLEKYFTIEQMYGQVFDKIAPIEELPDPTHPDDLYNDDLRKKYNFIAHCKKKILTTSTQIDTSLGLQSSVSIGEGENRIFFEKGEMYTEIKEGI